LILVAVLLTACGFLPGGWRNLFQAQELTKTATEIGDLDKELANSTMETHDVEQTTTTLSKPESTETKTPSVTASHTASSTVTPSLTTTPTVTFTNTYVYIPPTNTQIPPTNTRIPPSNTPIPPSATPKPTDKIVTEPPTQEPTEAPTEEPTEETTQEPTESPVCYMLTLTHEGEGSDPVASPKNSQDCPINQYVQGAMITLSNTIPASRWEIEGWFGTLNDLSVADNNRVKMPARDHTAGVIYGSVG